jgi:LTXXQ motif family protein
MNTKRMAAPLVAAMMLALPVGYSLAQTPPAPPPERHQPPSPETMARLLDGRIAMIKATLRLTDAQAKLFQPVEDMIRANAAERAKHREEWATKKAEGTGGTASKISLPERIEKMSEHLTKRAEKMKQFAAVLKPLYDSFSDEQKAVAGPLLAMMGGHHHGHGGPGGHHMGHHDMGPGGMPPPPEGAPK